jgi:hypothetical protein
LARFATWCSHEDGSLIAVGTLTWDGSLVVGGALNFLGSLALRGALSLHGSLAAFGALVSRLLKFGALPFLWLAHR